MGIINVRTILVALPTLYLFVALFYMNGSSTRRTEFTRGSSPQTVMTVLRDSVVGKAAAPVPVVAPAPAPVPVQAAKPAAPAPPAAGSGTVAIPDAIPPALDAKTHPQAKVKFYDGNSVTVYGHPDQGQGGANWWPSVEHGWEKDSLQALRTLLTKTPGATYIDFGSWIGPTVLFATPYAGHVWALEPDPQAYQELYHNVKANPHIADKVTTLQLCISDKPGTLAMHGVPGGSMSTVMEETDKQKAAKGRTEWTVQCMTLDKFIEEKGIDWKKVVIKMDTEGAERDILRQLKPFIAKYKPSMLLSMHVFAYLADEKAHAELQEIIMSYKEVRFPNGKIIDRKAFTVGGWCRLCALLLTDMPLAEGEVK